MPSGNAFPQLSLVRERRLLLPIGYRPKLPFHIIGVGLLRKATSVWGFLVWPPGLTLLLMFGSCGVSKGTWVK